MPDYKLIKNNMLHKKKHRINIALGQLIIFSTNEEMDIWLVSRNQSVPPFPLKVKGRLQQQIPLGEYHDIVLLKQFVEQYSVKIVQSVSQFDHYQDQLLTFCFVGGLPAIELMEDCPALAVLLAKNLDYSSNKNAHSDKILSLVDEKRHRILEYFSYPATKQLVKLFKKIPSSECVESLFVSFNKIILADDMQKIKVLRHIKSINRLVLSTLQSRHEIKMLLNMKFYIAASQITDSHIIVQKVNFFSEIERLILGRQIELRQIPKIDSILGLDTIHDQIVSQLTTEDSHKNWHNQIPLPKPPLPELQIQDEPPLRYGIFPLDSEKSLWHEGVKMHHCIASYASEIRMNNGHLYAYHVLLPDEPPATALVKKNGRNWILLEIRGRFNAGVSPTVRLFIEKWLEEHSEDYNTHP